MRTHIPYSRWQYNTQNRIKDYLQTPCLKYVSSKFQNSDYVSPIRLALHVYSLIKSLLHTHTPYLALHHSQNECVLGE